MIQTTSTSNKAGFTLIELLVSLVITMVGLLGLLTAINLSISTNMGNELRLQATGIAEDVLNEARQQPFVNITGNWTVPTGSLHDWAITMCAASRKTIRLQNLSQVLRTQNV